MLDVTVPAVTIEVSSGLLFSLSSLAALVAGISVLVAC